MPPVASDPTAAQISARLRGSSPLDGSSRNSTRGVTMRLAISSSRRRTSNPATRACPPSSLVSVASTRTAVVLPAIADADGLDAVTFRAVAARLGTGVMSLYNYVPDKQALVYDMAELVSGELELPEPSGDWRADLHLLEGRHATWRSATPG